MQGPSYNKTLALPLSHSRPIMVALAMDMAAKEELRTNSTKNDKSVKRGCGQSSANHRANWKCCSFLAFF